MYAFLDQKKCLITGAASGIGRATAILAAQHGALLCLCDVNKSGLDEVTMEIRNRGGKVLVQQAFDISDHESVVRFAEQIHQQHGSMDIVMNIAGISTWGSIDALEHKHWRQVIEINLMGPIHILECFVPEMIKAKRGGHIVNVSSAAGLFGLPLHAAYSASKFGLRGISEVLRFDLRQHRIRVSLVCPGAVNTGLVQTINIVGVDKQDAEVKAMINRFQKHAASPEKAAHAIVKGMSKNQYMIFTSWDIRIGYWFQRKFAWPYELVMKILNKQVSRLSRKKARMKT